MAGLQGALESSAPVSRLHEQRSYDPADFPNLLRPILEGDARVVYGARSYGGHAAYSFWFVLGNKGLALWASFLYDAWLTDIETCLKVAPTDLWRRVDKMLADVGEGYDGKTSAMRDYLHTQLSQPVEEDA